MFWFCLILIAATGALLGQRRSLIWGQWLLQLAMLFLLLPIWSDKATPGQQYSGLIGTLSCMVLMFLAPFIVALRGKVPLMWAVVWSALWSAAAIGFAFRADPQSARSENMVGTFGIFLFISVAGAACAALLVFLYRFFSRHIGPRP